ncbi:hypothetical protein [Vogesella indigofera]|uniref:hypothetical protein n=1 Tax=Vogesella indigofera TaxID=45465 RepID=UPI00234F2AD9|nr:hypothetical protein [Vogesella indigofera]MDC7706733.1 hypothetical protein [Vogesella indigofera]
MTRNAMTYAEFSAAKAELHKAYCSAKDRLFGAAFAVAEGLSNGESQFYIDSALSRYSEAKGAEELAFQQYVDILPPPDASFPDSE